MRCSNLGAFASSFSTAQPCLDQMPLARQDGDTQSWSFARHYVFLQQAVHSAPMQSKDCLAAGHQICWGYITIITDLLWLQAPLHPTPLLPVWLRVKTPTHYKWLINLPSNPAVHVFCRHICFQPQFSPVVAWPSVEAQISARCSTAWPLLMCMYCRNLCFQPQLSPVIAWLGDGC